MQTDPTATWSVRIKYGRVRLAVVGQFHQEFDIDGDHNPVYFARMLRRAMRRLAPEREATKRWKLRSPRNKGDEL
jgi:hypothetical protein